VAWSKEAVERHLQGSACGIVATFPIGAPSLLYLRLTAL
jgi:hypothetical protein